MMQTQELRKMGPRHDDGPRLCPACEKPIKCGEFTTLLSIGPADDPMARDRCRSGRPYNAVAIEVHWACATGEVASE